jgi:adenylosuccinate lyase
MVQPMASHCSALRCSPNKTKPNKAATAGSMLIMMPNASLGSRLSATISSDIGTALDTAATQWLERTLDDSSNRRLSLPESFLALDGVLDLMFNVASGLVVHAASVRRNLMLELPFMATENLLMECVKRGADRQHYHEIIRAHAQAAGLRVKQEGLENDLLDRLAVDPAFKATSEGGSLRTGLDWSDLMNPHAYTGRSAEQTERFVIECVAPLRERYGAALANVAEHAPRV